MMSITSTTTAFSRSLSLTVLGSAEILREDLSELPENLRGVYVNWRGRRFAASFPVLLLEPHVTSSYKGGILLPGTRSKLELSKTSF